MGSLDIFKPFVSMLPEIKSPDRPPALTDRIIWSVIALVAFFVMYNITAVGINPAMTSGGGFDFLSTVTASNIGSLLTVGIGPIVLASIFLQLFSGAKIIDVNMQDPKEKATFHGVQKMLAIFLCFFEAVIFVSVAMSDPSWFNPLMGSIELTKILVMLQIAMGSLILLYLDELVSRYGIGSGISLFIAAGVSLALR